MPLSFTLEELHALLGLLYSCQTEQELSPSLLTAASKLRAAWPAEIPLGLDSLPTLNHQEGIETQQNHMGCLVDSEGNEV